MSQLPSLELLKTTHDFPCAYVFKAIGKAENGFVARVVEAVREELALDADPPYSLRQTGGGAHVAVTLEPHVKMASEVVAVYRRLEKTTGLVMLL